MITESEKEYLESLSEVRANSPVNVEPYNPKIADIANKVIYRIRKQLPDSDIRFMGASSLKISGQNDIDIYVVTLTSNKLSYIKSLEEEFGKWNGRKWKFHEEEIEVSINLADPNGFKFKEHSELYEILSSNTRVLQEYETLKESMDGESYRNYQMAKYEFYNRVLKDFKEQN